MKFIKLHENGNEVLVNLSNVVAISQASGNKIRLFFNFEAGSRIAFTTVDETLDEILELIEVTQKGGRGNE